MTSPQIPRRFPNPVTIIVDRYTLGEAIRAAYFKLPPSERSHSWCTIADITIGLLRSGLINDKLP